MVIQKQYPVVASEGWFALALLSREKRGAEKVVEQLDVELVKKVLEEETSKDRDNAGVLVLELRKNLEVRREEMGELMDLFLKGPGVVVVEEIE